MPGVEVAPGSELSAEAESTEVADVEGQGWRVLVLVTNDQRAPFETWYGSLRDRAVRARIAARLVRILQGGNFGSHRERISGAISELKIDYGPGYRIYYVRVGELVVVLLGGGTKDTQQSDIERAVMLWERYSNEIEKRSREFSG
jgi:putative addiction module killer protein